MGVRRAPLLAHAVVEPASEHVDADHQEQQRHDERQEDDPPG